MALYIPPEQKLVVVDKVGDVARMAEAYLRRQDTPVAFDTETTGFNPRSNKLVSLQFMQFGYAPVIVDVRHWSQADKWQLGSILTNLFRYVEVVGMNLKFDWGFLAVQTGAQIKKCFDVMLAAQVIEGLGHTEAASQDIHFNLKGIAEMYGLQVTKETREVFPDMDKRPEEWNAPFTQEVLEYQAQDVLVLEKIYKYQQAKLRKRGLVQVAELENRALPAIASIEVNGILIDALGWRKVIAEKDAEAARINEQAVALLGEAIVKVRRRKFKAAKAAYSTWKDTKEAKELEVKLTWEASDKSVGWGEWKKQGMKKWRESHKNPGDPKLDESPINLGSSQQVLEAFRELEIKQTLRRYNRSTRRWESREQYLESTSTDVLSMLPEGEYPAVDLLLAWRKAAKFVNSFGETLLAKIDPVTGRIHPVYMQIGASTGRMSCTNPNWQQVPSKGDGKRLRALVQAAPGNLLLTADFSNVELRILADLSGDENMLYLFEQGVDLHSATARMMFKLGPEVDVKVACVPGTNITYRAVAKVINFGLVYGMSAKGLATTLKIREEQAQELMKMYFDLYPGVAVWLQEQRKSGVKTCVSYTVAGRKRYYMLPSEYDPEYGAKKSSVERKACNSPVQGSSADITKLALAFFYERAPEYAKLVAVVHDELVIEVPKKYAEAVAKILGAAMDDACRYYLHRVKIEPTVVSIQEYWEKA